MKKVMMCISAYLILMLFSLKIVSADELGKSLDDSKLENYISNTYHQIDFSKIDRLPFEVFNKAMHGYLNLRNAGKLTTSKDIISICDFNLPSTENRLWIIDLNSKKVLFNTYVAHGQGSGEDCASSFSNKMNSHQSSLGFYVTSDIYEGEHGTSLHLLGMDQGFNDAAYERDIVVHGADYVSDKFVRGNERLGRSWGCPAVPPELSLPIINTIKDGTCLFIYYPDAKYLQTAYWLNKKVAYLPEDNSMLADVMSRNALDRGAPKPRVRVVQYITNGKIDSVRTMPIPQ